MYDKKHQQEVTMDIYPLLYFTTIADTGNLTQAAKLLMISPPALSNALKRLERTLGVALFDRVGRNLVLNKFGDAYLSYARKILALAQQGSDLLGQLNEEEQNQLTVADITHVFASHLISEFLKQYPNISLRRSYVEPSECKTIDLDKTFDFAIGSTNGIGRPELCSIELRSGQSLCAVLNHTHPLADNPSITMQELAKQPMIAYATGQPGRKMLEQLFAEIGEKPFVIFEGNTPSAMEPALSRNLGLFIQPSHTAAFNMKFYPDCVQIPITGAEYQANTSLLWSPHHPQTEAARLFCQFCRDFSTSIKG